MSVILIVNTIIVFVLIIVLRVSKDYVTQHRSAKFMITWGTVASLIAWVVNFVIAIVSLFK